MWGEPALYITVKKTVDICKKGPFILSIPLIQEGKLFMASRFTIYSVNQISDLIYQISYIIYKISDILYQISNINKIYHMSIKISYMLYEISDMLYKIS